MATTHYRVGSNYLGGFGDGAVPDNPSAVECPPPNSGTDVWVNNQWQTRSRSDQEIDNELDGRLDDKDQALIDAISAVTGTPRNNVIAELRANYRSRVRQG